MIDFKRRLILLLGSAGQTNGGEDCRQSAKYFALQGWINPGLEQYAFIS